MDVLPIPRARRYQRSEWRVKACRRTAQKAEELAAMLGIDGDGLRQTIMDYNSVGEGDKDVFGRTLPEFLNAPFYGIA